MEQDKTTQDLMAKMLRVKQRPETWLYAIRRAPAWVTPKEGRPCRPFLFMALDGRTEKVLVSRIQHESPTPDAALKTLAQAVLKPGLGAGGRRRPAEVRLDHQDIAQALTPLLAQIGIRCSYQAASPQVDEAVYSLATYLNGAEPLAGLLDVPGVTVPLAAEFYRAAAEYYRRAVWRWIDDSQPIEVQYSGEDRLRFAVILGHGGETYGLALYDSLADLQTLYSSLNPEEMSMRIGSLAALFDEPRAMAFDDLDAIEAHAWPIAGENAYPAVYKIIPGARTSAPPTALDLSCIVAVLSVLPHYVLEHLRAKQGSLREAQVTYTLSGVLHGQRITLRHPALQAVGDFRAYLSDFKSVNLELFIDGWHSEETTHALAQEVGAFLIDFLGYLAASGLALHTFQRHAKNSWWIGSLTCRHGGLDHFAPSVFSGQPRFMAEFEREYGPSPTALSSYQTTWRKLSRFVRSLDDA